MRISRWTRLALLVLAAGLLFNSASAQDADTDGDAAGGPSPWQVAARAMQHGPATIRLADQATLRLPQGYAFVPTREASALMEAMGNSTDDNFIGLVFPQDAGSDDAEDWMVSIEYDPSGYIKDEDAQHWNADELLQNLKDGTEAANANRVRMGIPALEVTRWIEPPSYDASTQRLVWSVEGRDKGASAGADNTVNYNTYVLGREGYISLDLITSSSKIEAQKPIARNLLAEVAFIDGKRYADYDPSTDKLAAYGLAALVGGVAAKKLGLLAIAAAFLAKSFKLVAVAVVAAGAAIRKFFSRKA
ncbi:DUF2167 domain-containing protein [Dokdonella fugitiva]|jgi:uncharacterized membrane-anchored protein|uniref:Putative membrane-anchored protein n=1 Tax=Dokdonella fugitiva TaxID=328517 RepID=A0A4R2HYD2_9GAMM|nr:DUF2167 domain-containing protein [Dokdonella fugitiva]MBA8883088.1 putative membrane-anchored protein [Dokdonella fugitiva]TCO36522.1 putative membrane-anchored protein [Dokdonella fugitiva]